MARPPEGLMHSCHLPGEASSTPPGRSPSSQGCLGADPEGPAFREGTGSGVDWHPPRPPLPPPGPGLKEKWSLLMGHF